MRDDLLGSGTAVLSLSRTIGLPCGVPARRTLLQSPGVVPTTVAEQEPHHPGAAAVASRSPEIPSEQNGEGKQCADLLRANVAAECGNDERHDQSQEQGELPPLPGPLPPSAFPDRVAPSHHREASYVPDDERRGATL